MVRTCFKARWWISTDAHPLLDPRSAGICSSLLDDDDVPRDEEFFFSEPIRVHTVGIIIESPLSRPKFSMLGYYVDHYSPVACISEYEWNVARHDIHAFFAPTEKKKQDDLWRQAIGTEE